MAEFTISRDLTIDLPRGRVFEFFSDAANLASITPPELGFNIITPSPIEMKEGTLIDYKISLRGLPLKWRTKITVWDPPNEFVDEQISGPYSQWIHRHRFTDLGDGRTLIEDDVRYRLPLEPLGDLFHFIVKRELAYIFDHRQKVVAEILGKAAAEG